MSSNSFAYNEQSGGGEAAELGQEATSTISSSGAFGLFSSDWKKNEDLKQMLESNKDSAKLDAMKRIVGMIAKGKNASELFPAVVKNVASKNIEIKKLVYVYLVRYAEEQQDLALLSISTFQRALKDPNQLIRASALRVLSSIRVPIIVPIMMLAIKEASADLSPYVRKNAAHAIQKLYSLDPEQKEMLIEVIEKLLKDKSTDDGLEDNEKNFYDSEDEEKEKSNKKRPYTMDPDHRLLIRNTKPLLQSRNAAVVMAVAQLYWHISPKSEAGVISKSLVRLLRSNREVQYIVLQNIATMSIQRKGMFEPYLKSFYVRSTDPTMIKTLKTYVKSQDKQFAAATIQTIGRCATSITEVTDTCLNGLVCLLSNRDEIVVAESVVVIKKLLQMQPAQHGEIIKHMAKLLDSITVPVARASILWLIGENCERVPKIAPDVLRKTAKSFTNEDDLVKLQILNLGAKLYLTNSKQTKLLTQYILNLGKYDQNYDIRDRTRFIRQLIVPNEKSGALSKYAKKIFLAQKPAPLLESPFKDRDHFQLGTLSHTLNIKASGYLELSNWPEVAPDPSVRNVEVIESAKEWTPVGKTKKEIPAKKFYSESEEEDEEEEEEEEESSDSSSDSGGPFNSSSTPVALPPPALSPSLVADLEGLNLSASSSVINVSTPVFVPTKTHELLHRMSGKGLAAQYCFPRQPCIFGDKMVSVQITLNNTSDRKIENIHIGEKKLPVGMQMHVFHPIDSLEPERSVTVSVGIDFCDSTQTACFQLCTKDDCFNVNIQPPVGELLLPVAMSEKDFKKERGTLTGMNETSATIIAAPQNFTPSMILQKVVNVANLGAVPSGQDNVHRHSRTAASDFYGTAVQPAGQIQNTAAVLRPSTASPPGSRSCVLMRLIFAPCILLVPVASAQKQKRLCVKQAVDGFGVRPAAPGLEVWGWIFLLHVVSTSPPIRT
ncbi:AP-3 complex subunit beta-1 [Microtus ochrogaster]|uniref:AP-3 complex subunit beta n=1 Tax=Microtus ochrogaster TaxID=79684 RepID=A0A8J6H287_MICOH|nr:AP-3 complex subunit beta-1 [Microtus ochrogaster]